jgi:hypothetical protein
MDAEQEARARSLTPAELARIDEALLSHTSNRWKKVAMVIYESMKLLETEIPRVPDVFFASRIKDLAATGKIEAAGNLDRMRFSEVRLPGNENPPSAER